MPLLSDLGTHTKDDPDREVALSEPLEKHLRGSLTPLRPARPTTAIHQRVQALIDTSRAGSEKVAQAVETGGAKVDGLSHKLDTVATVLGSATQLGQRLNDLEVRLFKVEQRRDTPPTVPGESGIPPADLTDDHVVCLRAITQIDTLLLDKDKGKDTDELNKHLRRKSNEDLARKAHDIFTRWAAREDWEALYADVATLGDVPARIVASFRLRARVLQNDFQDNAQQIA